MMDFNFKWYRGKPKKPKRQIKAYMHDYYLKVLKPKRKKERMRNEAN